MTNGRGALSLLETVRAPEGRRESNECRLRGGIDALFNDDGEKIRSQGRLWYEHVGMQRITS